MHVADEAMNACLALEVVSPRAMTDAELAKVLNLEKIQVIALISTVKAKVTAQKTSINDVYEKTVKTCTTIRDKNPDQAEAADTSRKEVTPHFHKDSPKGPTRANKG